MSSDGLKWTFRLRSDAKFHDGSTVDADSVKRSLHESMANLSDRGLFPGLEDIVSIETAGPHELAIMLRNRSTFLLGDLSMPISKQDAGVASFGTGPFVTTRSSADQIFMSSFQDYYQGAPQIQQIIWKPYPALRTAWAGMMRGEIDFLYEVSQDATDFVQGESSVGTYPFLRQYVLGVVFNSSREPWRDPKVRRALNFSVNRELILHQALRGRGLIAHTPVWPLHWAYDNSVAGYAYDPSRAAAILDATYKFPSRTQGVSVSPARLRFTCLLPENYPVWERMALLVQQQLFEVGVDMRLEVLSANDFNQRIAKGDFDAVFLEVIGGTPMSKPYFFWHSAGALNSFGYRDGAVDQALDAIRYAPDDDTYRLALSDLQRNLVADPPGIFLAWGQTVRAVNRKFRPVAAPNSDIFASPGLWRLAAGTAETAN